MLRNKKQREEYLENKDNWYFIDDIKYNGKELFKVFKLKKVNVYKIEAHYGNTRYMSENWHTYGSMFQLTEDGLYKTYLNKSEVLEIIRNTEEPKERTEL